LGGICGLLAQKPVLEGVKVVEGGAAQTAARLGAEAAARLGAAAAGARGCGGVVGHGGGPSWGKLRVERKIEYKFYIML